MIAGVDPRRDRGGEWYLWLHGGLPRRTVVELGAGESHVDGELISGGRRLGCSWTSSGKVSGEKLGWGLGLGGCQGTTFKLTAAEEPSPE